MRYSGIEDIDRLVENLKDGDFFDFSYSKEYQEENKYWNHCFDGLLYVRKLDEREFVFIDTYWGINCSDSRSFNIEQLLTLGTSEYLCNANEVDKIEEHETVYYDDKDIIDLSRQHGCYKIFALKKGANRSPDKMLSILNSKIKEKTRDIEFAHNSIVRMEATIREIESGNVEVYI